MAVPLVAGVSVLLLTAKGKSADVAKGPCDLFETTSSRISSSYTDGAMVSRGELILNVTAHFKGPYFSP